MQNRISYFIFFMFIFISLLSFSAQLELKKVKEWNSDYILKGIYKGAFVNERGEIIIMIKKQGILKVKNGKVETIAEEGQGPGEIMFEASLCKLDNGFADIEYHRKIQIFEYNNKKNKYLWKKNIWREEKGCTQFIESSLYFKNKWFLGGRVFRNLNAKETRKDILSPYFLRVYDGNGYLIKNMVKMNFEKMVRSYLFYSFLESDDENVYFVIENKLRIFVIDGNNLSLKEIIDLKEPECYKKFPEGNYSFEIKKSSKRKKMRELYEEWKTNYSVIVGFKMVSNYFIFEIRNFGKYKRKKFALLFYNRKNKNLEKILYTNDFLLTKKDNFLYFLKGGIPYIDDEPETLTIKIYKLLEAKK